MNPIKEDPPMEWTVNRITADTFKIEGEIEIRFTPNEMVSDLREYLRAELEKQRAWLKEALKTIHEVRSMRPTKRLLTVKETAEYLGISTRTICNRIGRRSKNPFPVKPKRVGKHIRVDLEGLNKHIESI
jgi:predicted DNA-binding transcriptional regulator AlpA